MAPIRFRFSQRSPARFSRRPRGFGRPLRARCRRGVTLLESIISLLIVALGFLSTTTLVVLSQTQNDLEQERSRASQIVSDRLERIQRDLYPFITPGSEITIWDNGTPDDDADDTLGTIEVVARDTNGDLITSAPNPAVRLQVEVTLTWNPRGRLGGKTMTETVMTYIVP